MSAEPSLNSSDVVPGTKELVRPRQRQLMSLDYPRDNNGLDPDTDDTSSWTHMMELWIKTVDMTVSALPWPLCLHCYMAAI